MSLSKMEYNGTSSLDRVKLKTLEDKSQLLTSDLIAATSEIKQLQEQLARATSQLESGRRRRKWKRDAELIKTESSTGESPDVLLPPECWDMVFGHLDTKSLAICFRTCKSWEDVLSKNKCSFLFYEIIPLLAKYLNYKEILPLRLVSRHWKFGVDIYCQLPSSNMYSLWNDYSRAFFERMPNSWLKTQHNYFEPFYWFKGLEQLERFMKVMGKCESNPFITKSLIFTDIDNDRENSCEVWKFIAKTFLPKFGSHVTSIKFHFFAGLGSSTIKKILQACLKHLSNLVSLSVEVAACDGGQHYDVELGRLTEKEEDLLEDEVFPKLPSLVTLKAAGLLPDVVSKLLNDSLVNVKIAYNSSNEHYFLSDKMNSLEKLFLTSGSLHCLGLGDCPLRVLTFDDWVPLRHLESVTSRYKNTLEVLDIKLEKSQNLEENEFSQMRLDLPKLKHFRISAWRSELSSIDFILKLSSLEELGLLLMQRPNSIPASENKADYPGQVIGLSGYLAMMHESNIWKLLGKLEIVTVKMRIAAERFNQTATTLYHRSDFE